MRSRLLTVLSVAALTIALGACRSTPRTAQNFCRQLAKELPAIAEPPVTNEQITQAVRRFERLNEISPLEVESDWQALTTLMRAARDVDANDTQSVQDLVDLSYATEKSATAAAAWVLSTCGVDIATGLSVAP
ncbi:MAG: hypothetical protein RLZZ270_44 [Actinomycetota bacterium]